MTIGLVLLVIMTMFVLAPDGLVRYWSGQVSGADLARRQRTRLDRRRAAPRVRGFKAKACVGRLTDMFIPRVRGLKAKGGGMDVRMHPAVISAWG
jgi:hypothetical protein